MLSTIIDRKTLASSPEATFSALAEIRSHVDVLRSYYPGFDVWFNTKVAPQLSSGSRSILVEYREGQLAGFAIVKDDLFEQKLCCLRVMPDFQNSLGLGLRLFNRAFDELETTKPLLSVSEEMLPRFQRIFDYFGFEVAHEYEDYYRPGKNEFSVNGLLLPTFSIGVAKQYSLEKAA